MLGQDMIASMLDLNFITKWDKEDGQLINDDNF